MLDVPMSHYTINGGEFNDVYGNLYNIGMCCVEFPRYPVFRTGTTSIREYCARRLVGNCFCFTRTNVPNSQKIPRKSFDELNMQHIIHHLPLGDNHTAVPTVPGRQFLQLMAWARDATDTRIYWMNGMAGTGKTTIAYTFSERLDDHTMLGATFFCSRSEEDTKNTHRIFPTIAYELAQRFPSVLSALLDALLKDPDAGTRVMKRQFTDLIVTPLKAASDEFAASSPVILIIDALDECDTQGEVIDMLSILLHYSTDLPMKFFITSRPERHIRQVFNRRSPELLSMLILHDVEKDIVDADIEIYARDRLLDIADGRSDLDGSLVDWPPANELKTLVRLSGCLFIYAATACEYVANGGTVGERLAVVTSVSPRSWNGKTDVLDALYDNIVTAAYESADVQEQEEIREVLRAVVHARHSLSIKGLSMLLHISGPRVRGSLSNLHSIIHVPPSGRLDLPIVAFHTSFPDYITDHDRSGDKYLDSSRSHHLLALYCLTLMQEQLQTNVCCLKGRPPNIDVPHTTVMDRIPEGVAYACTYWASHAAETVINNGIGDHICEAVLQFFDSNVLNWIEYLSLLGRLDVGVTSLRWLESWARVCCWHWLSPRSVSHHFH